MPSKSTEAFSNGVNTSTKNPSLFVPSLAPIVVQLLFLILAYVVFPIRYGFYPFFEILIPNPYLIWGGYFIASIVGFIAFCMVVDMTNDVINGRQIDLKKSMNLVTGRLGTLIVAAIISAIFFITFFLIPVALFIAVIAIIEGTDAIESTKRSFDFVIKNLGEVIIFIIIIIVVAIILGIGLAFIPFVGAYIGAIVSWIVDVIFIVASVHFYLSLRQPMPPPPPTS
ncbi:MAG: hypothetical protein H3Z50_07955 [archaeon]|nr:hypothetical protein [archaeon]MCP8306990.1 hypothetical protein [archaeon]